MIGGGFLPIGPTLGYDGANQFFGGADTRMALANGVTGQETPAELASLGAQDKTAALKQAAGNTQYLYATAWDEANRRKQAEARQRGGLNVFG